MRFLALDEGEQICAHLVLVRGAEAVRRALVDLQFRTLDQFDLELAGIGERYDLVVVALDDQRRDIDLLEILGLVGLRERLDAEIRSRPSCPAARTTRAHLRTLSRPAGCSR